MNQIYQHYVYTPEGRIRGVVCNGNPATMDSCADGYVSVEASSTSPIYSTHTHYVLNGEPTERPASSVTRTDLTLYDVPNGATLWINGVSYSAEGEVELDFTYPGTYSLRVECFPYLDWTGEVVIP